MSQNSAPQSPVSTSPSICQMRSRRSYTVTERPQRSRRHTNTEDLLVTPFAQLMTALRNVRSNVLHLGNPENHDRLNTLKDASDIAPLPKDALVSDTVEELDWCLKQLELLQTHRSVSDMTSLKFKRLVSRELSHMRDSSALTEYICNTFLEQSQDVEVFEHQSSRRLRHTDSFPIASLPKYGVTAKDPEKLEEVLSQVERWGIDIFQLVDCSGGFPLTAITYTVLQERDLIKSFHLNSNTVVQYLHELEGLYHPSNPYHNSTHAADVVQAVHVLLLLPALAPFFNDLELLSAILAAAIHDVDHPGVTNQYLINTGSDLAVLYNDVSVLENHHLAIAFQLMQKCNMLEPLNAKQLTTLRRMMIDIVLATDMSKHMGYLADLKTLVEAKRLSGRLQMDNYTERIQVLQNLVHCADLSNPTKPLSIYQQWTARIMEELHKQGDMERSRGLDISPMCDRQTASVEKTQVGFIDFIVHPLWETWADLVEPDCQDILDTLEDNRDWYHNMIPLTEAVGLFNNVAKQ